MNAPRPNDHREEWFGALPESWRAVPLRYLVRFVSGGTPDKGTEEYWNGRIPWVSPKDMKVESIEDSEDHVTELALEEAAISLLPTGTVLLVVRGMILAHTIPVAVTTGMVTINQDMKGLRCRPELSARFLRDVIRGASPWFVANTDESSHGTKRLETEVVGRFLVPLPPIDLQESIADFLDTETTRIDALLAAKENLLTFLAEKRKALITHAVTRGLDPNVPLKASGIPWLGQVPDHWKVIRLKFLLHGIEQGWSPQCDNYPAEMEEWGVLKTGCVNGELFDETENKRLPDDLEPRAEYEVRENDFLMSRANTTQLVGSAAVVRTRRRRLLMSDKLYRLRIEDERLNREFLELFINSPAGRHEFERDASGASNSMQNISQEAVRNLWLVLPPLDEQAAIVRETRARLNRLDQVREAARRTVALLQERRKAIIAAAVTGQLDLEAN